MVTKEEKHGFNPRDKKKLPIQDLEYWEKHGENEEDGEEEGKTFD